jgi:hypothetical protein
LLQGIAISSGEAALEAGTDLFLTNDKRLVGKFADGIQFVASLKDDVL